MGDRFRFSMPRVVTLMVAAAVFLLACVSAPSAPPDDLDAAAIVQRAQEASDNGNYAQAILDYRALGERFASDPNYSATAQYEIAFIDFKEGRKAEAKSGLEALLARYDGPEGQALPPRYQILAQKILEKIK